MHLAVCSGQPIVRPVNGGRAGDKLANGVGWSRPPPSGGLNDVADAGADVLDEAHMGTFESLPHE
jgi:hypothetical protein